MKSTEQFYKYLEMNMHKMHKPLMGEIVCNMLNNSYRFDIQVSSMFQMNGFDFTCN